MSPPPPVTAGVLSLGEMGAALAELLRGRGVRVVTSLRGRSAATARRCADAGVVVRDDPADVVRESDVFFSLVPPAEATAIAGWYCGLAHAAPAGALYVDVNSIGPGAAAAIAARVSAGGVSFLDAAVNGLAKNLTTTATLFLSGPRAGELSGLLAGAMRVRVLGDEPGRASAMKMLLSGVSKGICALYAELALLARARDMLPQMIEETARIYPGVAALADRMLPTYAQHAARRATEMSELEATALASGLTPPVIRAVRQAHEELAAVEFTGAADTTGTAVVPFIEHLAALGFMTGPPGGSRSGRPAAVSGNGL